MKAKEIKRTGVAALSAALLSMLLIFSTGCSKKEEIPEPEETVEAFYTVIAKQDASKLVNFGYTKKNASSMITTMKTAMSSSIVSSINSSGAQIDSKQADEVAKAQFDSFKKLKHSVKTTSKKEKKATVQLKTQSIDYTKLQSQLVSDLTAANQKKQFTSKNEIINYAMQDMVKLIKNAKATSSMKTVSVDLSLKEVTVDGEKVQRWIPDDGYSFGQKIGTALVSY